MIKRTDPKAVFRLISIQDSALDESASNLDAYKETLDIKHLAFKEGMAPTIFLAQNISAPQKAEINDAHYQFTPSADKKAPPSVKVVNQGVMMVRYFESSVKTVEENGKVVTVSVDEFPAAIVQEIGAYIMRKTSLEDESKK